jgi:hypothetical protein
VETEAQSLTLIYLRLQVALSKLARDSIGIAQTTVSELPSTYPAPHLPELDTSAS